MKPVENPARGRSILITSPQIGEGGMSRMIEDFAQASIADGDRVSVLFPPGPAADELASRLTDLGADAKVRALSRPAMREAVRKANADWVLLVTGAFPPSSRLGWMLLGLGVPVLETLRAMPRRLKVSAGRKLLYRLRGAKRYRLLVINQEMERASRGLGGSIAGAVVRVPNGVRLPDAPADKRWGEPGVLRLVSHSRLNEQQKDHETSLRAMAKVTNTSVTLTLLGDGPDRARLESLATELGLGGRVVFEGQVPGVLDRVAGFDAALLSTRREGLPRVAVEAMALGLPVIGSDVAGVRDVVSDERNGLLVPAGDADAMAGAIGRLAADAALRERLGSAAMVDAREHDHARTGRVIRSLAEELLG